MHCVAPKVKEGGIYGCTVNILYCTVSKARRTWSNIVAGNNVALMSNCCQQHATAHYLSYTKQLCCWQNSCQQQVASWWKLVNTSKFGMVLQHHSTQSSQCNTVSQPPSWSWKLTPCKPLVNPLYSLIKTDWFQEHYHSYNLLMVQVRLVQSTHQWWVT